MTPEQMFKIAEALTNSLNELEERLDRIESRIENRLDHLVNRVTDHFDIEWATKREVEEIKTDLWRLRNRKP